MRPPRADIAIPPLPPGIDWVGDGPRRIEQLSARGPVLVHFIELGEPNAVRTVPYLNAWHERYRKAGLSVIGVHSPRWPIARETADLAAGCERLGIGFAVANDREQRIWHDYGCRGWPSTFLWRPGGALVWVHFGEGEYEATEGEIQRLLAELAAEQERPAPSLPDLLEPLRPEDAPGAPVRAPSDPVELGDGTSPWSAKADGPIELDYEAGSAWATADGTGTLLAVIDDVEEVATEVSAPGAYELARHQVHGAHRLRLRPEGGARLWSVRYAPGLAG